MTGCSILFCSQEEGGKEIQEAGISSSVGGSKFQSMGDSTQHIRKSQGRVQVSMKQTFGPIGLPRSMLTSNVDFKLHRSDSLHMTLFPVTKAETYVSKQPLNFFDWKEFCVFMTEAKNMFDSILLLATLSHPVYVCFSHPVYLSFCLSGKMPRS
jgi:hypothetical protein